MVLYLPKNVFPWFFFSLCKYDTSILLASSSGMVMWLRYLPPENSSIFSKKSKESLLPSLLSWRPRLYFSPSRVRLTPPLTSSGDIRSSLNSGNPLWCSLGAGGEWNYCVETSYLPDAYPPALAYLFFSMNSLFSRGVILCPFWPALFPFKLGGGDPVLLDLSGAGGSCTHQSKMKSCSYPHLKNSSLKVRRKKL